MVRQVQQILSDARQPFCPDIPFVTEYLLADRWYKCLDDQPIDESGRIVPKKTITWQTMGNNGRRWSTEIGISLVRPYYHPRTHCRMERAQKIRGLLLLLTVDCLSVTRRRSCRS